MSEADKRYFRSNYSAMATEELLDLREHGELLPEAQEALLEELEARDALQLTTADLPADMVPAQRNRPLDDDFVGELPVTLPVGVAYLLALAVVGACVSLMRVLPLWIWPALLIAGAVFLLYKLARRLGKWQRLRRAPRAR